MSNVNSAWSPAMNQAVELIKAGKGVEAEAVIARHAQDTQARFGRASLQHSRAMSEWATILLNADQPRRAIQAYQTALEAEPTTPEQVQDRLTLLVNLAHAHQLLNELDEAEQTLRQCLDGRMRHYGREHAGYAFGLEPLAILLLKRGKAGEAAEMLEEAVANYWNNAHPRLAEALVLRAEAFAAAGREEDPFACCTQLEDEWLVQTADAAMNRVGESDAKLSRAALTQLEPLLRVRLGEDHRARINTLVSISNVERLAGDQGEHALRIWAIEEALASYLRQGQDRQYLLGLQGLALAHSAAGDQESAAWAYERAAEHAASQGDTAQISQLRRNYGLFLAEIGKKPEAERQMSEAVSAGDRCGDAEMAGRARVALGIFYQHNKRPNEARPLLERALELMNPAHPDAICCRSHLGAIVSGASCGCGDQSQAIADAFRQFVMSRLDSDILERLDVCYKDNDFELGVHLKREPREEELEQLQRVVQHALAEFRTKVRSEY